MRRLILWRRVFSEVAMRGNERPTAQKGLPPSDSMLLASTSCQFNSHRSFCSTESGHITTSNPVESLRSRERKQGRGKRKGMKEVGIVS